MRISKRQLRRIIREERARLYQSRRRPRNRGQLSINELRRMIREDDAVKKKIKRYTSSDSDKFLKLTNEFLFSLGQAIKNNEVDLGEDLNTMAAKAAREVTQAKMEKDL